jgi:hypothetical protein
VDREPDGIDLVPERLGWALCLKGLPRTFEDGEKVAGRDFVCGAPFDPGREQSKLFLGIPPQFFLLFFGRGQIEFRVPVWRLRRWDAYAEFPPRTGERWPAGFRQPDAELVQSSFRSDKVPGLKQRFGPIERG